MPQTVLGYGRKSIFNRSINVNWKDMHVWKCFLQHCNTNNKKQTPKNVPWWLNSWINYSIYILLLLCSILTSLYLHFPKKLLLTRKKKQVVHKHLLYNLKYSISTDKEKGLMRNIPKFLTVLCRENWAEGWKSTGALSFNY